MIGIENPEDGTVFGIYCHYDGYPAGVGRVLTDHYQSETKIRALMDLGDISSLGKDLGEKHDFKDTNPDVCRVYGRDRGEPDTEARAYPNREAFLAAERGHDYSYLFSKGKWEVFAR